MECIDEQDGPYQAGGDGMEGHLSVVSKPSASSTALASMLASQAALVSAILASMSLFRLSICRHQTLKSLRVASQQLWSAVCHATTFPSDEANNVLPCTLLIPYIASASSAVCHTTFTNQTKHDPQDFGQTK